MFDKGQVQALIIFTVYFETILGRCYDGCCDVRASEQPKQTKKQTKIKLKRRKTKHNITEYQKTRTQKKQHRIAQHQNTNVEV